MVPAAHHFEYYKYQEQPAEQIFEVPGVGPDSVTAINVLNVPNWLLISDVSWSASAQKITFKARINQSLVDSENFAPTDYAVNLKVTFEGDYWGYVVFSNEPAITLTVYETVFLEVSPTVIPFQYIIGDNLPQSQAVQISTQNYWTASANQSWVVLSQTSGNDDAIISVSVDPSGLTTGQYQDFITVQDSVTVKYITISLNITEGDTETEFIYITPTDLQFISEVGVENTTQKIINIDASHSWTASANQSWIQLSASSGSSGVQTITVTVDSESLTDTDQSYLAEITFLCQGIQKTVYVELILVEFFVDGIQNNGLYFVEDRNYLQTTNTQNNMFLQLLCSASNGSGNINYTLESPYINGLAKRLMGFEANQLLKSLTPPTSLVSGVRSNVTPLVLSFKAYNRNFNTQAETLIASFSNVRFLKGHTSTNGKMCYLPDAVNVSKDAILSLSVLATASESQETITLYNENLQESGGEWDTAASGSNIIPDSTDFANTGSKSVKFNTSGIGQYLTLTKSTPVVLENALLKFAFKQTVVHAYNFKIDLYNTQTGQNHPPIIVSGSSFGLDPNSTDWQIIAISIPNVTSVDKIRIMNLNNASLFYLDDIELLTAQTVYGLQDSDIVITGDATATISTSINQNQLVYNALVNLAPLNLSPGNQINIAFSGLSVDVVITDNVVESTLIAFENEWQEYELFECRGFLTRLPKADQTTTKLQVEGKEHETVTEILVGEDYTINTGYIYTLAEMEWLAKLLASKRTFVYLNNAFVEVIFKTKNLETYQTRKYFDGYDLKFTKAIV